MFVFIIIDFIGNYGYVYTIIYGFGLKFFMQSDIFLECFSNYKICVLSIQFFLSITIYF